MENLCQNPVCWIQGLNRICGVPQCTKMFKNEHNFRPIMDYGLGILYEYFGFIRVYLE